jgi:hypothetical protein
MAHTGIEECEKLLIAILNYIANRFAREPALILPWN